MLKAYSLGIHSTAADSSSDMEAIYIIVQKMLRIMNIPHSL
jgi:hypothetical protein